MSLRDVLREIRNQPTPPNEETAKFQIIAPVLQGLGWNPFSGAEVLYEHRVETARGSGRVDIALLGETRTFAHIEAKSPGRDLNKYAKQALGYAFDEGVDICALTTGLEWQLYLPREAGPHSQRLFTTLRLQHDPTDQLAEDLETFLGKDNLLSGRSERRAKEVLKAQRQADHLNANLPEIWSRMVNEPDERLVELVTGQAYKELNLRPAAEQVKAVLRGAPVPAVATQTVAPPQSTSSAARPRRQTEGSQDPPAKRRSPRRYVRIVAYELWGERHEVTNWTAMLVGVAEALYQRHSASFDRILTLRGTTNRYASRRQDDISRTPKAVGASGIYIETYGTVAVKKRRAAQFLKLFGHSPDDLRIEEG